MTLDSRSKCTCRGSNYIAQIIAEECIRAFLILPYSRIFFGTSWGTRISGEATRSVWPAAAQHRRDSRTKRLGCARRSVSIVKPGFLLPERKLQPSAAASWRGSLARCSRINLCVTHCAERPSLELLLPNRQVAHGRASRYLSRGFPHPRGVYNYRQQHRGAVL